MRKCLVVGMNGLVIREQHLVTNFIREGWCDEYEDISEYNCRVVGMNSYIKKRKKSENTKKRRKKPLIDLIDNNGHIKSLREGQL